MASSELTALLPTEAEEDKPAFIDPLSLTSSHRAGILAGIWTATFLASLNSACSSPSSQSNANFSQ